MILNSTLKEVGLPVSARRSGRSCSVTLPRRCTESDQASCCLAAFAGIYVPVEKAGREWKWSKS